MGMNWRLIVEGLGIGGWFRPRASSRANSDDFWFTEIGQAMSAAGIKITPDTAMQVSAVGACVRLISGTTAKIPLHEFERDGEDGRRRVRNGPLEQLFRQPNPWQSWFEFRRMMTANVALYGNAYAQIISGPLGFASQLIPLPPRMVTPKLTQSMEILYEVLTAKGPTLVSQSQIFHLRDLSVDGVTGLSRIQQHVEGIGLAKAAEIYTASVFGNNADFGALVVAKKGLQEQERKRILSTLKKKTGAQRAGKTLLLEGEIEVQKSRFTNVEAQTFELRNFQISDIARIFGVPEHLIGQQEKQTSWGTGVEQQNIGFLMFSLMDWLVMWESAIQRDLVVDPENRFMEHNVDGLLRGDFKTRMEGFQIGIQNGIWCADEVRKKFNEPPRADGLGGRYHHPANMAVDGEESSADSPADQNGVVPFPQKQGGQS